MTSPTSGPASGPSSGPASVPAVPAARRPGRPRSSSADAAILGATRELLAAHGWSGLTVEGVAARAGVAKTTVYRRWSSRTELAIGAVAELLAAARTSPGDSAEDDIVRALRAHADVMSDPVTRGAYLALVAESARDDALRERFTAEVLDPGLALVSEGMARAEARGEVTAGLDVDLLHDLLAGPLVHRVLVRGGVADDAFITALARILVAGARALAVADDA